jgi:hypothetical protein
MAIPIPCSIFRPRRGPRNPFPSKVPRRAVSRRTQAFGLDSPSSTRVIGYREESAFTLKKVRPVSLVSPAKGTRIAGLDARKKGVTLRWRIGDAPEKLTVRLRRNGAPWPVPLAWRSGVSSVTLPSLPEGTYSWDVRASSGEFDLSSGSPQTFVVLSVPKLPAPKDATPGDKAIVGPDELKARELRFAWSAVPGATHYTFRVRAAKTGGGGLHRRRSRRDRGRPYRFFDT